MFFKEVKLLKDVPTLEKSILVKEKILNVSKTKNILTKKLKKNKIRLFLNREFKKKRFNKLRQSSYCNLFK